jgi:predicted DNA-binding helix-hairpin-helix protein
VGPRTARRLVATREQGRLGSHAELRRLGVARRALPFLLVGGRREGKVSDVLRATRVPAAQLELALGGTAEVVCRV